ncbi:MAG: polyphosphate polymerase domain-containing protein [Bacteroidales bacterium]|jgi:hypothetical protein|nr:polyphosphate polymerase domain-containing protein [Bacteroidales bacterium]
MSILSKVESVLNDMSSIDLEAMNHVKLMRRRDTKYVIPTDRLAEILELIKDDYRVFTLEGQHMQPYETVYFDTPSLKMYFEHHNRRLNRYKVRMRKYVISGESYLEIKFQNNRGETIKKRVRADMNVEALNDANKSFLSVHSPFSFDEITPSLWNSFKRITLVSKHRPERLTIDLGLEFSEEKASDTEQLNQTCIIEVKRDLDAGASDIMDALNKSRIKATGFSKYCIGMVLTKKTVRHNLFKQRLRKLGLYNL